MRYIHRPTTRSFTLQMYPFKTEELETELKRAGFGTINTYGDYSQPFDEKHVEFLTHVCLV